MFSNFPNFDPLPLLFSNILNNGKNTSLNNDCLLFVTHFKHNSRHCPERETEMPLFRNVPEVPAGEKVLLLLSGVACEEKRKNCIMFVSHEEKNCLHV